MYSFHFKVTEKHVNLKFFKILLDRRRSGRYEKSKLYPHTT